MDDILFQELSDQAKRVAGTDNNDAHDLIDDIVVMIQSHHVRGTSVFDISHILLDLALAMNMKMAHLDDASAFAKFTRDQGETMRKIISEHWPPPDRTKWPYNQ